MKIGRTIRVGLTVALIFFGWYMRDFLYQPQNPKGWHFRLFSAEHWAYVWNEFKSGWVITATSDWIFVLTIVFMIPVFILIWWWACKVSWRKSIKTVFRKIKNLFFKPDAAKVVKKKISLKAKGSHKKVRPQPINAVGRPAVKQTGKTMDAHQETSTKAAQSEPVKTQPVSAQSESEIRLDEDVANIPLDEIQLPEQMRLQEDLAAVLSAANYQVLKDVVMNDVPLAYVGISEDTVVLCMTDSEKGDWLADEEFFNGEEPLWFSESAHRISPVYRLNKLAQTFSAKLKKAAMAQAVVPVLIEKEGTIINAPDMLETWKKMEIVVCRTDLGGPEELPSFTVALPTASGKGTEETFNQIRELL